MIKRHIRDLIGVATQNGLLHGVDVGTLACRKIESRQDSFAALENADAKIDLM